MITPYYTPDKPVTLCQDCDRKSVCKFKEKLDQYQNEIASVGEKFVDNPFYVNILCKHFKTSGSSITYLN